MYPLSHFLFPFFIAEILVKLNLLSHKFAILAGLIGLLIDLDHFIYFAMHHGDFSIKDAWNAAIIKNEKRERTFVHHKIGFILITLLITIIFFFNRKLFLIILIGYYSHMFLDYVHLNILNIKERLNEKEAGFVLKFPVYELIFDVILIIGVGFLILQY